MAQTTLNLLFLVSPCVAWATQVQSNQNKNRYGTHFYSRKSQEWIEYRVRHIAYQERSKKLTQV